MTWRNPEYAAQRAQAIQDGSWTPRKAARPTLVPTPVDIGWAAGFLEGEGLAFFGGTVRPHGSRDIWSWSVYGQDAIACLEAIAPHMSTRRRERIDTVLLGCTRKHI